MKGFLAFLNLKFIPCSPDFGLLILRAGLGASMLFLHGWKKVQLMFGWGGWTANAEARKLRLDKIADFYDLHIGKWSIGSEWSLRCAAFVEVVCSALLIIGFCTRFAAAGLVIVMAVAFFLSHQRVLSGPSSGEMAMVYLLGFAALLVSGPGKYSFDGSGGGGH